MPRKSTNGKMPNGVHEIGLRTRDDFLPADRCLEIHRLMLTARKLEERMIKMAKSGEGYFWIGGPGEEAFNIVLGLQVHKGQGPAFDYLHLHYRNAALMLALGMPPLDALRQMVMSATDPSSWGRNFAGHFSRREWNVIPVTSVIEIQYVMAPGTAHVQKRLGGKGVSIVVGGDAGTAEGDFESCLIWSSRPGNELPLLAVVTNNGWGISTRHQSQHACEQLSRRGQPYGIPGETIDGNDPVSAWFGVERALAYCRKERKPFLLEAMVSRLHGHSSSSGAVRIQEADCLAQLEKRLLDASLIDAKELKRLHDEVEREIDEAALQAVNEPKPVPEDVEKGTYAASKVDAVYPNDYTGLP